MGRRLLALSLSAALPVGAICAPLLHAHADDHHDIHHLGIRIHAHLGGHGPKKHADDHSHEGLNRHASPGGSAFEDDSGLEQVTSVQLFVASQTDTVKAARPEPLGVALLIPSESVLHLSLRVSHGHDPPFVSRLSSRAPPVTLFPRL